MTRERGTQRLYSATGQDQAYLAISEIIDSPPQVNFKKGATPPELPGYNKINPQFTTTVGFLVEAVSNNKGIGQGESLSIKFSLKSGKTYNDVITDLDTGELRIGVQGIRFSNGGAESFVNTPEPMTLTLLGLGMLTARMRRRG